MAKTARESLLFDLEDAISRGPADRRISSLRQVTDLFLAGADGFDETIIALFDDVIGRLADEIEIEARAELAGRLASHHNAPPALMRTLAADTTIDVAQPVLIHSPVLSDEDLVDIARTRGQLHLRAIAGRSVISPVVTDVLIARGDLAVAQTVAGNAGARFSSLGLNSLVDRAEKDETLQLTLGRRRDLPPHLFRTLVARATQQVQKRLLALATPGDAGEVQRVLASVADRLGANVQPKQLDYSQARPTVQSLRDKHLLTEAELLGYARSGQIEEMLVALELMTGIPLDVVERLVLGSRPDPVLILGKAAGFAWPTVRAVITARPGAAGTSTAAVEKALMNFDCLSPQTAQRVVRFWQVRHRTAGGPLRIATA